LGQVGIVAQQDRGPPCKDRPSAEGRLKVHLRLMRLGGATYRVITLRPGTPAAFSTNYFHNTWHIVTDRHGARLLARLLWGLAYQRQPGTLVLVHGAHLRPTPFEAERSDPFILAPAGLTRLDASALRRLKAVLPRLGPPTHTARWLTFGLDEALAAWRDEREDCPIEREREALRYRENRQLWSQERMERRGGFICYSAPPPVLRYQALAVHVHALRVKAGDYATEMDYHYLAERAGGVCWWPDGEVQIFADYRDRVAAATQARAELLVPPNQPVLSETLQEVISRRRDQIKQRRSSCCRRRAAGGG
jgi:hypothetical protein